jgi:CheY-like chemotaxis protein
MTIVLFVDDFVETADSLAELASALGHQSTVAYSGETAISAANQRRFDVVFMDVTLPDMDGRDVCDAIREGLSSSARIFALTGHSELAEDEMRCFDGVLLKPLAIDDLERLLAQSEGTV